MKLTALVALLLLQTPAPVPDPGPRTWLPVTPEDTLPRFNYPAEMSGHTDLERLERVMAHVRAGIMPEDAEPQITPVPIQPGDAIRIEWTYIHNVFRPVKFRLWLDGAVLKNFVPADLTLTPATPVQSSPVAVATKDGIIPPFTAAQIGLHTIALTNYDAAGTGGTPETESKQADASFQVQVNFTGPPPAPTGFRIVVIKLALAADGTMRLLSVTEEKP